MADERVAEAVAAARVLLESGGPEAVTMRAIAEQLGIRAPSLYKHVPNKAALEAELIASALREFSAALEAAGPGVAALGRAYRDWALAHPHLYSLSTTQPLRRELLPSGLEARAAAPVLAAAGGDPDRARALWAGAHGLVSLELADRFPPEAELDRAWAAFASAFS